MKIRFTCFVSLALLFAFGGTSAFTAEPALNANIFVDLSKKVVPSVVNISTLSVVKSPYNQGGPDELFRRFFEDFFRQHGGRGLPGEEEEGGDSAPPSRNAPRAMALGTGFIIDASGLILTNNHVVAGADEIKIQFTEEADEKPTDGEVVGRDPELDLALIKVTSKRTMVPVALGDSDALEVGEYVIAIGNPFGQGHSVTHGIISAKERKSAEMLPLASYLQTDAPINPGNSGGPLVNLKGEVIGINNAIDQRAQGIGFAIPINSVKKILPQLRAKGSVSRGYIGVLVGELTPEVAGQMAVDKDLKAPFITHVYPGDPAAKAGLKPYDVVLKFGGKPIRTAGDLINAVTAVPVDESVPMEILRNGKPLTVTLKVGQRPGTQQVGKKDSKPKKKDAAPRRLKTGMELEDLTPELAQELGVPSKMVGVVVASIAYGSPADQAGLMRGDLILEVDRKPVRDVDGFFRIVRTKKSYLMRVRRTDPQGRESFSVIILDLKGK